MSWRGLGAYLGVFGARLGLWGGLWCLCGPFPPSWGSLFDEFLGSENREKPMFRLSKTMIFKIFMGSDFGGFKRVSGEVGYHKSSCQGASQGYLSGKPAKQDCRTARTGGLIAQGLTRRWPEARRI